MGYTLQQMRDYVRTSLDVDVADIPDSILDMWVREGWQRVVRRLRRWPFLEKQTTFNTVGATATYLYTTINANLDTIVKVTGPNWDIKYVSIESAERAYPRNVTSTGEPRLWTRWAKGIRLWPTPPSVYSIDVRYYEAPIEWVATGPTGTPSQLPDEFHDLIAQWALMRAHAQQEDLDLQKAQKMIFDELLINTMHSFDQEPSPQPIVFGGGNHASSYQVPPRLHFPFE